MRDLERDILLASSGELSWWRHARLAFRLARDPEARRLAETLTLLELTARRRRHDPSTVHARRVGLALAGVAVLVVVTGLLAWTMVQRPSRGAEIDHVIIHVAERSTSPALHESSRRVLLASMQTRPPVNTPMPVPPEPWPTFRTPSAPLWLDPLVVSDWSPQ